MSNPYDKMVEKAADLAFKYEATYLGCSQTTVAALIEAFGIGGPDLLRASTCMAGGVALRGNVCGVLTGGLMMIGYLVGRDDLQMFDQYQRAIDLGKVLYQRFEDKFGTVTCPEIHKLKFGRSFNLLNQDERDELHRRLRETDDGCQAVARDGARLAAELIVDILKDGPPLARMLAGRT
jgi:C_GCAxxG_C_C family probable redox protein